MFLCLSPLPIAALAQHKLWLWVTWASLFFLLSLATPFPASQLSPSHSHSYLIFLPNQWLIGRMLLLCPFHNVIPLLRGYLFWTVVTKSQAHASLPRWRDMPPHIAWRKAVSLCRWSIHSAQTAASLLPHSRCQTIALLTLTSISAGPRSGMRCYCSSGGVSKCPLT